MQDGTLVMSFGHKPDYREDGNYLAFSTDHGSSWGWVTQLSMTPTKAYTGVREVSAGELFVAYTICPEPAGSGPDPAEKFDTVGRSIKVHR